jgi:hypothetical protein
VLDVPVVKPLVDFKRPFFQEVVHDLIDNSSTHGEPPFIAQLGSRQDICRLSRESIAHIGYLNCGSWIPDAATNARRRGPPCNRDGEPVEVQAEDFSIC